VTWDVVIVGAGAAGLATGIFTRAPRRDCSVLLLDGARKVGAKILVSGGSRCNVTNTVVTERDYWGGPSAVVRRVLRAYPASEAAAFFTAAGVRLHEEEDGKLFPDSHRSRDVLDALLRQVHASGCVLRESSRVTRVEKHGDRFLVTAAGEPVESRFLVLATGGMSLPRSGSDGGGYAIAQSLGHTIVSPTPALAPLVIDAGRDRMHTVLSGVSVEAELTLWVDGAVATRLRGPLLWTHFGISGPVALNMSRHLLRAQLEGRAAGLTASFMPAGFDFEKADRLLQDEIAVRPRGTAASLLGRLLPSSMAAAFAERLGVDPSAQLAHLGRDPRRALTRALTEWRLEVQGSRGYNYAEVTAGGVDLREVAPATMESRVCPGLYLVGEILDVDGRLGGFNFQWAWSSAHVAARALRDATPRL
jgi:predicted Rossmann fold flavoprotein